ncbi:MAG: hypothetical protein K2N80_03615 [Lachnospiraceae bacterium]|nr:hypothetical protein [Lachnospiraceae bacterium]
MESMKIKITNRQICLTAVTLLCFILWYLGIPSPAAAVSQDKMNSGMNKMNENLCIQLNEMQNRITETAEKETGLISDGESAGGLSDGLQELWQDTALPINEIPTYWYFTNAGHGHYHLYYENEAACAVKKYAGMSGMENEAWALKRISFIDGMYHAYVESETGNELYILLSEMESEMYFIIMADIRNNGEAEILLQDERFSYNSMLKWYSFADWFYGEKDAAGTICFEREGEFFDHMYTDGCRYAIHDYLERTGYTGNSEWVVKENLLYVGRNGYIADIYCTNGGKGFSFLIDVWNHSYAVLE